MILALGLLALLPQVNETLALVLSVFLGMGTVVLVNRRYEQLRQRPWHAWVSCTRRTPRTSPAATSEASTRVRPSVRPASRPSSTRAGGF